MQALYERFINGELSLEDAANRLKELARSNVEAGTVELHELTETERERVAQLLREVTEPAHSAFMRGEITADAAAREMAPFLLPHSVWALSTSVPEDSDPTEAFARFGELNAKLIAYMREIEENDQSN